MDMYVFIYSCITLVCVVPKAKHSSTAEVAVGRDTAKTVERKLWTQTLSAVQFHEFSFFLAGKQYWVLNPGIFHH